MIYIDSQGVRVETTSENAATVRFFRQGGGFEQRLPAATFHRIFKPAPPPAWRPGTVTAEWFAVEDDGTDAGKDPTFPCWSNGDRWNGWGVPYFTKATIDELIVALKKVGLTQQVEWVDGKLMYTDPDEDETYEIEPITVQGCDEPLYGLGAGNWTWDAVEFGEEP